MQITLSRVAGASRVLGDEHLNDPYIIINVFMVPQAVIDKA